MRIPVGQASVSAGRWAAAKDARAANSCTSQNLTDFRVHHPVMHASVQSIGHFELVEFARLRYMVASFTSGFGTFLSRNQRVQAAPWRFRQGQCDGVRSP